MKEAKDLFEAVAASPLELAMLEDGRVGFVIPEYQRPYDWSEGNITRLYYDILNGFTRTSEGGDANAFTFLGAVILVKEEDKEEDFDGISYAVVDGQQRLTTLSLFACALNGALHRHLKDADFPSSVNNAKIKRWIEAEINALHYELYACAVGSQHVSPTKKFPFPRIIRHVDSRGRSEAKSEYRSVIAQFLYGFSNHCDNETTEYEPTNLGNGTDIAKLLDNYERIRGLVSKLNDAEWYEDTECELFDISWSRRRQYRTFFSKFSDIINDEADRHQAIEEIIKHERLHALLRTLLFASYFCRCIVLTRVTTRDASAAFDIFDTLNTTGEPLTALETLKPRVIKYENKQGGYAGTPSESAFSTIDKNLDQRFSDTTKKQTETKDLIITFALYLEGKKLSKDLAAQRNFLRQSYDNAVKTGKDSARRFVSSLADSSRFRRYYWEDKGIEELGSFHPVETVDEVKLLMSVISKMKMSLALPILSRYWSDHFRQCGDHDFVCVLRTLVSFVVLRRAATGGTAGIDSDLRAVMAPKEGPGSSRKYGLCASFDHSNDILPPEELKEAFRALLNHKIKNLSRESWVGKAVANPLYNHSRELVRFMILIAAHQAAPLDNKPGLWNKAGIRPSANTNNFLNYETWRSDHCGTVEHIAPQTEPTSGWDDDLYRDDILKHTLGNLVLLPEKENNVIGSYSWVKKRKLYLAFTEKSQKEVKKRIDEAEADGIIFPQRTKELIKNGKSLPLLDPLRSVEKWNARIVRERGRNIAELCWDHLWPWLN
ncbi:MAG: DUF262 domain-containing HNH endonuclease family protein [Rhodobacteraceae bacterium]|nr:DUF262 domain-containing HNH endonuclease family protein [Paracoccaceae bacterium]